MRVPLRPAPRTLLIVAANLVPLVGVLALGWSVGDVFLLFWAENALLVLVFLAQSARLPPAESQKAAFLLFVYGAFLWGHYDLFVSLFVGESTLRDALWAHRWPIAAVAVAHVGAFLAWWRATPGAVTLDALALPLVLRLFVLHVGIILGVVAMAMLGVLQAAAGVLIVAKLAAEIGLHAAVARRARKKSAAQASSGIL